MNGRVYRNVSNIVEDKLNPARVLYTSQDQCFYPIRRSVTNLTLIREALYFTVFVRQTKILSKFYPGSRCSLGSRWSPVSGFSPGSCCSPGSRCSSCSSGSRDYPGSHCSPGSRGSRGFRCSRCSRVSHCSRGSHGSPGSRKSPRVFFLRNYESPICPFLWFFNMLVPMFSCLIIS